MHNRITTKERLAQLIRLTSNEERALSQTAGLAVAITPHFAALMDRENPNCPIRRQVVPTMSEFAFERPELEDPLSEDAHMPVPGLVHRYPDRVMVAVTDQCASYCRHCTRRRIVGRAGITADPHRIDTIVDYLEAHRSVRDVLISGGDGLILSENRLDYILSRVRSVKSVEIIRLGTRVPIYLPQRITKGLLETIRKYHPVWMKIHINHPKELAPETAEACAKIADAGIPMGSQTVLLAGVNDCPHTMRALIHKLVKMRVRPYYLYQCDLAQGTGHFRTPVGVGLSIIEALRGHTTGFAVPTYCVDTPNGGGKVPLMPDDLMSMNDSSVAMRNFEGDTATYPQPERYRGHRADNCEHCREAA